MGKFTQKPPQCWGISAPYSVNTIRPIKECPQLRAYNSKHRHIQSSILECANILYQWGV